MRALTSLPVTLGRDSAGADVQWDILHGAHLLVTGETRSGKSVFSYNVLAQLAERPQVRVVGVDPTTVLLRPFRERFDDPWIALGAVPKQYIAVMNGVHTDVRQRLDDLYAQGLDKLSVFDTSTPLLVVVLEELPGIMRQLESYDACNGLKPAERLAPRFRERFETLAAESAKAGVRLVCLAQRPDAGILGGYAREQLTARVSFRVSNPEGLRMMFGDGASEMYGAASTLDAGYGLFREPGPRGVVRFRADFVGSYRQYAQHVEGCDLAGMLKSQGNENVSSCGSGGRGE